MEASHKQLHDLAYDVGYLQATVESLTQIMEQRKDLSPYERNTVKKAQEFLERKSREQAPA